jgi:hypothetical protein
MSLLFRVIMAARCTSSHHKLAIDALRHLRTHEAERWRNLFLSHYEAYLEGSKAPDKTFRDFRNHVLHVREDYWGGAIQAAATWYDRAVQAFRRRDWQQGVYAAGVLSHYYTDPIQPFHTGQTEEEGGIHRAVEWSIAKSYEELQDILEQDLGGYPQLDAPSGDDWLAVMIRRGAEVSNPHYDVLIDHYDLDQGVKNPPMGLDQELRERLARLVGYATVGLARIYEQIFHDARVSPPPTLITLHGFLATLKIPVFWITRKLADRRDRAEVEMIYEEVRKTGKAVVLLPDDDRAVRRMHAEEVLGIPIEQLNARKPRPTGKRHGQKSSAVDRQGRLDTGQTRHSTHPLEHQRSDTGGVARPGDNRTRTQDRPLQRTEPRRLDQQPPRTSDSAGFRSRDTTNQREYEHSRRHIPDPDAAQHGVGRYYQARDDSEEEPNPTGGELESRGTPTYDASYRTRMGGGEIEGNRAREPGQEESNRARGQRSEAPDRALKYYLDLDRPVVDAPSIGAKTARRLRALGIRTVADLLDCIPEDVAGRLDKRWITAATIRDWQAQATLVCRVPGLRGHDAQILVGCGITDPQQLAYEVPEQLLASAEEFAASTEGQRVLWSGKAPDLEEVSRWIRWAKNARTLRAA